jgi:hypothetical protein
LASIVDRAAEILNTAHRNTADTGQSTANKAFDLETADRRRCPDTALENAAKHHVSGVD